MNEITLILDRRKKDLWIKEEGRTMSVGVLWNVDGIKMSSMGTFCDIMRKGKIVGLLFGIKEVREKW